MDRLRVTDVLVVVAAVACAQVVRFGRPDLEVPRAAFNYTLVSVTLALTWIAFLAIFRTRSPRARRGS